MTYDSRLAWIRTCLVPFVAALSSFACADDESGISYTRHVSPLLQERCVYCHFQATELDVNEPFTPGTGLFARENRWLEGHRPWFEENGLRELNVVPHDPEASFLLQKVSDPALLPGSCDLGGPNASACPIANAGPSMPPPTPPATPEQIGWVRQWIQEGARDTRFFRDYVAAFFGRSWRFGDDECTAAGYAYTCMRCISCHDPSTPTSPDLKVPNFDETGSAPGEDAAVDAWLTKLVGVKALYRSDLLLVDTANPEASFLLMKLAAKLPSTAIGAPMPLELERLSETQVETLRQWIAAGARNN